MQILSDPQFQPERAPRDSPIAAVVLASADVDQVTGLLHLREFQPLRIYASSTIQRILREENSIFRALNQTEKQAEWETTLPNVRHDLKSPNGDSLRLTILPVSIGESLPGYARKSDGSTAKSDDAVLGLFIEANKGRVFCASSLPRIDERWLSEWNRCDAILIDGTFWIDDELVRTRGEGKTAREMGHVEGPRADTSLEALAKLKPVFQSDGTVTAGNSSQTSDGAAVAIVMSSKKADELGLKPMARFVSFAVAGVPPEIMGIGPVVAIPKALALACLKTEDIGVIELNEAFAVQALAVIRKANLDLDRVNPNGGAIALGHPIACTGSRILTTLIHEIRRPSGQGTGQEASPRTGRRGLATLCVSGGLGVAVEIETV